MHEMGHFVFSIQRQKTKLNRLKSNIFIMILIFMYGIALIEGMEMIPIDTESWKISISGDLIGKPWNVRIHVNQTTIVHRLFIHKDNDADYFVRCTKLGKIWHGKVGNTISRNRLVKLNCPDETDQSMCVHVSSGGTEDIGLMHFEITGGLQGKITEIYSNFFIFKNQEYPDITSDCIDMKNPKFEINMDFVEVSEFSADAYFKGVFLCKLNRTECQTDTVPMDCRNHLACEVDHWIIERMEDKGNGQVTVVYISDHVQRNVTMYQALQIKNSCRSKENGYKTEIIIGISLTVLVFIVFIFTICFVKYKQIKCNLNEIPLLRISMNDKKSDKKSESPDAECGFRIPLKKEIDKDLISD